MADTRDQDPVQDTRTDGGPVASPRTFIGRRRIPPTKRRVRPPRRFGEPPGRWSRFLSPILIALVMGTGAFLGVKLSRGDGAAQLAQEPPSEVVTGDNGHQYLWGKVEAPPAGKLYWGAFRLNAPYDTNRVTSLEREVGRRPAVLMWFQEWAGEPDFPVAEAGWLFDRGIVPMVTWEPWRPPAVFGQIANDQPSFSLTRIVDGAWDDYITRYAEQIKAFGGPVMLRPMHEMDGFWYPWSGTAQTVAGNSPVEFIKAWRHIWRIFRDVGATNVTWVWSVNHVSLPATPENQIQNYWPGKKYVDWVAFSGFNWGTASPFGVWKGFDAVERERYVELTRYGKPVAITEMGAPEQGGNKARWIVDSFHDIMGHYPDLQLVIWYDKQDTPQRQWQIDSSPESLEAFRHVIADADILDASAALATATPHVPR
jgi:glycosyl hydrolase family 26